LRLLSLFSPPLSFFLSPFYVFVGCVSFLSLSVFQCMWCFLFWAGRRSSGLHARNCFWGFPPFFSCTFIPQKFIYYSKYSLCMCVCVFLFNCGVSVPFHQISRVTESGLGEVPHGLRTLVRTMLAVEPSVRPDAMEISKVQTPNTSSIKCLSAMFLNKAHLL
jgi:hypothetical protein